MVLNNLVPSAMHSLSLLTETLEKNGIDILGEVKGAVGLSYYAVTTRYPGHYEPIEEPEFLQALSMAKQVVAWVESRF